MRWSPRGSMRPACGWPGAREGCRSCRRGPRGCPTGPLFLNRQAAVGFFVAQTVQALEGAWLFGENGHGGKRGEQIRAIGQVHLKRLGLSFKHLNAVVHACQSAPAEQQGAFDGLVRLGDAAGQPFNGQGVRGAKKAQPQQEGRARPISIHRHVHGLGALMSWNVQDPGSAVLHVVRVDLESKVFHHLQGHLHVGGADHIAGQLGFALQQGKLHNSPVMTCGSVHQFIRPRLKRSLDRQGFSGS